MYSNITIEVVATLRLVFSLPYRQTTGFLQSIIDLMGIDLKVPTFSTLTSRVRGLVSILSLHK